MAVPQLLGLHYSREWGKCGSQYASIPISADIPSEWTTPLHQCAQEDVQGHVAAPVMAVHCTPLGGAVYTGCAASSGTFPSLGLSVFVSWVRVADSLWSLPFLPIYRSSVQRLGGNGVPRAWLCFCEEFM